jgi:hypothetical protein
MIFRDSVETMVGLAMRMAIVDEIELKTSNLSLIFADATLGDSIPRPNFL